MFAALRAGQIDAAITDTSITLAEEIATEGKSKVVGQYKTGETYGGIMQKGNANNEAVSKIIQSMIDDGTMAKLGGKYLAAGWGKDPATFLTSTHDICSRAGVQTMRPRCLICLEVQPVRSALRRSDGTDDVPLKPICPNQ